MGTKRHSDWRRPRNVYWSRMRKNESTLFICDLPFCGNLRLRFHLFPFSTLFKILALLFAFRLRQHYFIFVWIVWSLAVKFDEFHPFKIYFYWNYILFHYSTLCVLFLFMLCVVAGAPETWWTSHFVSFLCLVYVDFSFWIWQNSFMMRWQNVNCIFIQNKR